MPTATAGGYGTYSPREDQPYTIENTLAKLVGENSPAAASNMLDLYQIQHQTALGNYDYAMQGQHEFAKQQLAQQLQEEYMKNAMVAIQHPGGLPVLNAVAPGALTNLDPNVANRIEGGLTNLQNAKVLQDAGAGAYSAVQAGRPITDAAAAAASGGLLGPQGTPLQMQIEAMKEGAANARAAAAGAREKEPTITNAVTGTPIGSGTYNITGGGKTRLHSIDDFEKYKQEHGFTQAPLQPGDTGGQLPPGAQPKQPVVGGGTTTNLQTAPRTPVRSSAPPTGGGQVEVLSNKTPGVQPFADDVRYRVQQGRGTPEQRAAIQRGMDSNGGQPKIGRVGGKPAVLDDKNNVVVVMP